MKGRIGAAIFAHTLAMVLSKKFLIAALGGLLLVAAGACDDARPVVTTARPAHVPASALVPAQKAVNRNWKNPALPFGLRLSAAAEERARHGVVYDGAYVRIAYPNGDVPADRGVCSDEVIRAYRLLGVDLQRLVHEDMARAFGVYPKRWGLPGPDSNIDHRRVPNLAAFFSRAGARLSVSTAGRDYKPGDVVAFVVAGNLPHIGIVTERWSSDGQRPLIMHNIGRGPQIEDVLFTLTITGHYRYGG
ncbi:MAG: DUF1287 domain-containing protein [Alphaproteobacteria bacterium]|nr:DUF1287 domain-containing protein [Alphaproteobacteria bacterium]